MRCSGWMAGVVLLGGCPQDVILSASGPDANLPDPEIAVEPAFVQFGELAGDESASKVFVLTNVGDGFLDIDRIRLVDPLPGFTLLVPDGSLPAALAQGESTFFEVQFRPAAQGLQQIEVQVISDAQNAPDLRVPVAGSGAAPDMLVSPDVLGFPDQIVSCVSVGVVRLENVGREDVVVSAIRLERDDPTDTDAMGDTDEDPGGEDLSWGVTPMVPLTLAPGEDRGWTLLYEPTERSEGWGRVIVVESNDPDSPHVVPITGSSTFGPSYAEQFVVPADKPIDLLFAIDQSGSMGDQANLLAAEIGTFTQALSAAQADWRIGVYTGSNPACLASTYDDGTPGWEAQFALDVRSGSVLGGGAQDLTEALLSGLAEAAALDDVGLCNEGFRRSGVPLHVVIVSDERDQSSGFTGGPSSYWMAYLQNLEVYAGGLQRLTVHGVLDLQSACGQTPLGPSGYRQVVQATGGELLDVCGAWAGDLDAIVASVMDDLVSFQLARTDIEPASVAVAVDGTLWTQGWRYDAASFTVYFDVVPPPGAVVDVTYEGQVDCSAN